MMDTQPLGLIYLPHVMSSVYSVTIIRISEHISILTAGIFGLPASNLIFFCGLCDSLLPAPPPGEARDVVGDGALTWRLPDDANSDC